MWKVLQRGRRWPAHDASGASAVLTNDLHPSFSHIDPMTIEDTVPVSTTAEARIEMAASCRDADPIPKVRGAGRVVSLPDGRQVQVMHNGVRVVVDGYYGAWMTRLIERCSGHHEPQE